MSLLRRTEARIHIPVALRSDLYARAALACAAIVSTGYVCTARLSRRPAIIVMVIYFALRYMAIQHRWHLPKPRAPAIKIENHIDLNTKKWQVEFLIRAP